eukprot:9195870-Pyramimonas_sp.AAC.1
MILNGGSYELPMRDASYLRMEGVSLAAKVVLNGDSSAKLAVAPAVQRCRMLRVANTSPRAMISAQRLLQLWEEVRPDNDTELSWANSRGPIRRAVLAAQRAGWA